MDDNVINLDPQQEQPSEIDLNTNQPLGPPPEIAELRAAKAAFGGAGPTDYLRQQILQGNEDRVREAYANQIDIKKNSNLASLINNTDLINPAIFKPTDPKSVFEEKYAEKVMDGFHKGDEALGGTYHLLASVDPEGTAISSVAGKRTLAWVEFLKHQLEDANTEREKEGWGPYLGDMAKDFIPGFRTLRWSTIPGGTFAESPFPGDKLENLRERILAEPDFDKQKQMVSDAAQALNPGMKTEFLSYLLHPTHTQQYMDNALSLMDFWALGGMAKAGAMAGIKPFNILKVRAELKRMRSETVHTMAQEADTVPIPAAAMDAVGLPEEAGRARFGAEIMKQLQPAELSSKELLDGAQSILQTDINNIVKGGTPGNGGGEMLNRLRVNAGSLLKVLAGVVKPTTIADALKDPEVLKAVLGEQLTRYPGLSGNVIQSLGVRWNSLTNRWVGDHILGTNDAGFFTSPAEAARFAEANGIKITNVQGFTPRTMGDALAEALGKAGLGTKDIQAAAKLGRVAGEEVETTKVGGFTAIRPKSKILPEGSPIKMVEGLDTGIYSQGKGYYISVSFPIDETTDILRQGVIKTEKALSKNSGWLNQMGLGGLRTSEEVLSAKDNIDRKVAVYAASLIKEALHETLKPLAKAVKQGRREVWKNFGKDSPFERLLKYGQDNQVEFQNIPDLQHWYLSTIGREANETEIAGYFAYRQGLAMDYVLRNLALVRNMHRVGGEQHLLTVTAADGTSRRLNFVGVRQNHTNIPDTRQNVLIQKGNTFDVVRVSNLSKERREAIENGQTTLMRVYDPDNFDMSTYVKGMLPEDKAGRRIGYVLSDKVETKPLDFVQLPRRQGGHIEYDHSWYIKRPTITQDDDVHYYSGDRTIAAVDNSAMAHGNAKALNAVGTAIKAGDLAQAQILAREVKGATWKDIKEIFDKYGTEQPFYAVPKGRTVADVPNHFDSYGDSFRDSAKGGSLAKQFQVEFTGERDAYDVFAFHDNGTVFKPDFAYRPAEYIDPIASLARAVTRISDSTIADDVKISSMESWLTRYREYIDPKWQKELMSNPWRSFVNAPLKSGLPANLAGQIEAERLQIKMFSRLPTKWDTRLAGVQQFLENSIYGAKGPLSRIPLALTKWSFDKAMTAPEFMRAVTYRADIGFFSLPQILVQSNTYVTIAGIAGFKKAGQGTSAAALHQMARMPNVNEEILNRLDKVAQSMGWRPGEWKEAREYLSNTGFDRISKEQNITMEDAHGYKIVKSAWGSFLNAGEIFFKEGERNAKFGAWYTAFKEFRDLNPTGRLTNADLAGVLNRADLLSGNMTRASKSALQQGPLAFPTQFIGYSLRIMEQFTGKRLTPLQKLRLFGVYGLIYGIPFTTGLFSVVPFTQKLRTYAMEHGYIEKESDISDSLMNGVPSMLMQHITGTTYNVGSRYGNLETFDNILAADKSWWEILGGATLNTAENLWTNMVPFWKVGVGFVKGEEQLIKPTLNDFISPMKTFAAGNSALRFLAAVNTGEWLSRNEGLLARNVPTSQAAWMTVTGLSPIDVDKIQLRRLQQTNWEEAWKQAEFLFTKDYRRFLRDMRQKNFESAREHWNNANIYLTMANYPLQRRSSLFAQANENQTIPESELWHATFGKNVPAEYERYRQNLFARENAVRQGQ